MGDPKKTLRQVSVEVWTKDEEIEDIAAVISDRLGGGFYVKETKDVVTGEIPEAPRKYFELGEAPEEEPTDREIAGRSRFEQRVRRLTRFYELKAAGVILANEALLVLDAVRLMYPEEVAHAEGRKQLEPLLRAAHLCRYCQTKMPDGWADADCPTCQQPEP